MGKQRHMHSFAFLYVAYFKAVPHMSLLEVFEVSRQEENERYILKDISFTQQEYQKLAIAGATGSGKTTLLKIIAGLIQPTAGEVLYKGLRVKGPEEKLIAGYSFIGYLSQHFELPNHYRVEEILEKQNQLSEKEARLIYTVCRIDHLLNRWTHQLSGGEKQRIALARLLISSPKLLLLDEPYSNIDILHKNILKSVIKEISEDLKITCLLVSHDPVDVLSWADEVIVLEAGELTQKGSPVQVYNYPVNEYTAALFGKYNLMSPALAKAFSAFTSIEQNKINTFLRPEQFVLVSDKAKGVKGQIKQMQFMGGYDELEVCLSDSSIFVHAKHGSFRKGDIVYVVLAGI